MNRIVTYLESKEVIFHGALALIILYVPHAGHLFKQLEHLDMTIFGFTFINWFYRTTYPDIHYKWLPKNGKSLCVGKFLHQRALLRLLVSGVTRPNHSKYEVDGNEFSDLPHAFVVDMAA